VITVYDPIVHSAVEEQVDDPNQLRRRTVFDTRYVKCQRPTVITGGELSLNMLNLVYNPTARTYQAPLQLKSTGGIFIVDDLGRQAEPPQSLVNRWIVPLEESKDILALQSGEKFEVPFNTLVIFRPTSTQMRSLTKLLCVVFSTKSKSMVRLRKTF
jgi:predicted ATPase with chaperone activity